MFWHLCYWCAKLECTYLLQLVYINLWLIYELHIQEVVFCLNSWCGVSCSSRNHQCKYKACYHAECLYYFNVKFSLVPSRKWKAKNYFIICQNDTKKIHQNLRNRPPSFNILIVKIRSTQLSCFSLRFYQLSCHDWKTSENIKTLRHNILS